MIKYDHKVCILEELHHFLMFTSSHQVQHLTQHIRFDFIEPEAAIEVATIMILEVSYGWSPELCGSAFAIIAGTSLGFLLLSMWLLSNNLVTESTSC